MQSDHKADDARPPRSVDVPPIGIDETLRQLRIKKDLQAQLEPVSPKRKQAAVVYGDVPNDLDRIAQATSEMELLDLINQVLQVLRRSGRMAEVPESLRLGRLATSSELRMAMRRMQGAHAFMENVDWLSDAMLVLRAVLNAAEEKLRQLRR